MTRKQFMGELRSSLEGIVSPMVVQQNIDYYENYINEQIRSGKTEAEILRLLGAGFVQGFTLLGGEPFEPENQVELVKLLKKIRETYPQKDIWCYSGYLFNRDMVPGGCVHTDVTEEMLSYIDVLVDGEF